MAESFDSVVFVHSLKARRMRITVRPDKRVIVTIPHNGSKQAAEKFLRAQTGWIQKQFQKIDRFAQLEKNPQPDLNIDLRKAQDDLFNRLYALSIQHNLPYRRAAFRCQRTKWGSCSHQNNISLNINMVFLPTELQDYLLLHELLHTKIKNHSRQYWDELNRLTAGRAKEFSQQLKKHKVTRI